jgi:hypothetical protein
MNISRKSRRFIQYLTAVALTLLFTPIDAAEKVLASYDFDSDLLLSEIDSAQGVIKKLRVEIEPENLYLASMFGPARQGQQRTETTELVELSLLPVGIDPELDSSLKLEITHFGQYVDGVDTFSGIINGDETTAFVFSVENEQVTGQVRLNEHLIKIHFDKETYSQVLSVVDLRIFPRDKLEAEFSLSTVATSSIMGGAQALSSPTGEGNIRVLFYYTEKVASRNNINSMVANILSELNTSIDISDINPNIDFTKAAIEQLGNDLDNLCRISSNPVVTTIHSKMLDRASPFDVLDSDLTTHSADIALVIATTEPAYTYCSSGGRIGGVAAAIYVSDDPIAMTTDTYALGDLTAPHELGHVIGGNHEIESPYPVAAGTEVYARGYVSSTNSWQTLMGGYNGCAFDPAVDPTQQPCTRLNRWSNPSISYQNESTGVLNESEMKSALEITAPIVSGWTSYPTPVPVSSPTISNDVNGTCTYVSWPFIFGSTHYQVFTSFYSSFSGGGDRVGITNFPGFVVTVPLNQTYYVRVRACNGNGCGPYSNILPVTYHINCT